MLKILVSACLLGQPVRYDGKDARQAHSLWLHWQQQGRLVPICPEVSGGLPTPRPPAEWQHGDGRSWLIHGQGRIVDNQGQEQTQAFAKGAQLALQLARQHHIQVAILKANSPSCGKGQIYAGQFDGQLIPGDGMTAATLQQAGIQVFNEHQLEQVDDCLQQLEASSETR